MKNVWIIGLMILFITMPTFAQESDEISITRETAPSASNIVLTPIVSDLNRPLYVTHAGDESGRLFLLEQSGKIWVIDDGQKLEQPFLDVSGLISSSALGGGYSEQGLLGLAFHPNYDRNGYFFINYTDTTGATVVARYNNSLSNPNIADAGSAQIIFNISQPFPNHNGGHMAFGPDGYLYISLGDGGSANDPLGAGQNTLILLGSILRLDVDNGLPYAIPEDNPFVGDETGADEIWSYGLRNVWRFSFDALTGDMYLADVGQNEWEEINFQPADSIGGENYGWNVWEATHPFARGTAENHVLPIAEYNHSLGCSVTGGYVYRGDAIDDLDASYLFSDYCTGRVWASYRDSTMQWNTVELLETNMQVSSFGEDEAGELYIIDYSGTLYRFDPA
jgi:glucose/arabinose dehydrogenase